MSNSNSNTSLKRPFNKTWSVENPESYTWWRKVSATKTKPTSTEKIKKTQFATMKISDGSMNIKEYADGFKPATTTQYGPIDVGLKRNVDGVTMDIVKSYIPNCKEKNDEGERKRVLAKLEMFRAKCKELLELRDAWGTDLIAKEEFKKQMKLHSSSSEIIGDVPGVKVGDRFGYRAELVIVGLHGRTQLGIDYMVLNGKTLATCVVAKEGCLDKMKDSDVISITGEGGIARNKGGVCAEDQKLTGGNLAMKNSMMAKNYVRVVRGIKLRPSIKESRLDKLTYLYDGLYRVVSYEEKKGPYKNLIFEFKLKRCPGQPVIPWQKLKNLEK